MIEKTSLDNQKIKMKKRNLRPASTFVLTFLSLVVIYFVNNIAPFGQKSIMMSDLSAQYAPYLVTLRNKILSGSPLSYSMEVGMGKNFIGIFAYYLSSPLNLIILLVPSTHISNAIVLIIMLKLSFAGCFMTAFLERKFASKSKMSMLFGLCYALSSFPMTFAFNFIWLDGFALLPLLILLTESFYKDHRQGWKLFLCIVCLIFSNYYMAYMVGLFSFLYLLMLVQYDRSVNEATHTNKRPAKTVGLFILIAICAAMACAAVLIPAGLDTIRNGDNSSSFTLSMQPNFQLRLLLGRLFIAHLPNLMTNQPMIYSSLAVFALVILFFLNKDISKALKYRAGIAIVGAITCFLFQPFNLFWHAFNDPNWFLFRYSFLFIFGTILLAYYSFLRIRSLQNREFILTFIIMFGLLIIAKSFGEAEKKDVLFFQNLVFMILILVCLWAPTKEKWLESLSNLQRAGTAILIPAVLVEILFLSPKFTVGELWGNTQNEENFATEMETCQNLADFIPTDTWGRLEQEGPLNANIESLSLSSYTQTQGMGCFCSMANKQMQHFLKQLGFKANFNYTEIKHVNMIQPADSVLGVRYVLSKDEDVPGLIPLAHAANGSYTIYENPYAVQIAMLVPSSALTFDGYQLEKEVKVKDYFLFQEKWIASLTGQEADGLYLEKELDFQVINAEQEPEGIHNIHTIYNQTRDALNQENIEEGSKNIRYYLRNIANMPIIFQTEIEVEQDMPMYFVIPFLMKGAPITVYCNGEEVYHEASSSFYSVIIPLGQFEKGETVHLEVQCDDAVFGSFTPSVAWCDLDVLEAQMDQLREGISEVNVKDGQVTFSVDAKDEQVILTTIPYEKGWVATVDGQTVEVQAYQDAFVCFPVSSGAHQVELRYEMPGQKLGAIISVLGLATGIALCVWLRRKHAGNVCPTSEVKYD